MRPKKVSFGTHVGTSLILLIFMVLCLISFATLSLVNANADWRLTRKLCDRQTAIYTASHEANAFMAAEGIKLDKLRKETSSEDAFMEEAGKLELTKKYPISDNQSLTVTLVPDREKVSAYRIDSYQITTDTVLELDETLPLYTGD